MTVALTLSSKSLARRLLVSILSFVLLFWLTSAAVTMYKALDEVSHLLDQQLIYTAYFVHGTIPMMTPAERSNEADSHHEHEKDHERDKNHIQLPQNSSKLLSIQLEKLGLSKIPEHILLQVFEDNVLRYRSSGAPFEALSTIEGFSEAELRLKKNRFRVFTLSDGPQRIIVATTLKSRHDIAREFAEALLTPLALLLPLLAAWIVFALRRGFRVFRQLNSEIRTRPHYGDQAWMSIGHNIHLPSEITPLVETLNILLHGLGQQINNERAFTANAAHELRTPLAALSSQLHVVAHARNEAERSVAIAHAQNALKRASHLINSLLLLARIDSPENLNTSALNTKCLLLPLVRRVLSDNLELLNQNTIEVTLESELTETTEVLAHEELLAALLNNLIRNAAFYAYPKDIAERPLMLKIDIRSPEQITIEIKDWGRGIPETEREIVLRRFYRTNQGRLDNSVGAGLGLAIGQKIAQLMGDGLRLSATRNHINLPGLSVGFTLNKVRNSPTK